MSDPERLLHRRWKRTVHKARHGHGVDATTVSRKVHALEQKLACTFPNITASVQHSESLSGNGTTAAAGPGGAVGAPGVMLGAASAGFNLSYELDLFGRRPVATLAADADLAAVRFSYEAARAALVAKVADALFSARGLAPQIDEAGATLRIQRDVLRIVRVRAARGLSAAAEVARVDADVAQAEAQLASVTAELVATRRAILTLVGDALSPTDSIVVDAWLPSPPFPPSSLPSSLLERRPDVHEAEARLRAGVARARMQRLELFPRLTLNPGTTLTATRGGEINTLGLVWTLGAGLAVPLLDRTRLLAELRAEGARAEQAAVGYERAIQTAFSEADQAIVRLAADRRRVDALTRGERQAEVAYAAARLLLERGLTDLSTLLDAERTRRAAQAAASTARTDALRRSVTVFRALGGGWDAVADVRGTVR